MAAPESDPPSRLISHFRNRDSNQQSSGWTTLWDTDQSDLWDRGKPSPALIDFIESKHKVLSHITNKHRPKALIPGCGKGYDVVALALHGFDVHGLEISETGAAIARRYADSELAEPSEYNYHDLNTLSTADAKDVTIITGDFFQKGWEPHGLGGFDLIYDYTAAVPVCTASFLTASMGSSNARAIVPGWNLSLLGISALEGPYSPRTPVGFEGCLLEPAGGGGRRHH